MKRFCQNNVNVVIFENEITLYWDKQWELDDGITYHLYLNGKDFDTTEKTHYEFTNLSSNTEYSIKITGHEGEVIFCDALRTENAKTRIDVTKPPYNAVGDGKTINTTVLQKALDQCSDDQCVYLPEGVFLTGALNMHSNTELYIDKDAVLQGSGVVEDYAPKVLSRFEGTEIECYRPLINIGKMDRDGGCTTNNVVIRGGGCLFGGGKQLCWSVIEKERERLKEFLAENAEYVKTCENEDTIPGRARPFLINMNNAQNVVLTNLTIGFGAAWNVHFNYCKDVLTYNCAIKSRGVWNGDGWNPDSSENSTIFATRFDTHDDAIAIKSGKNPQGNIINRPTKDVRIFDCGGCNGIACGSELSGGISGVYVWDCDFNKGGGGFNVKTTRDRGGYAKNIKIRNCKLVRLSFTTACCFNNDGESSGYLTEIENIDVKNIELLGVTRRPECPVTVVSPIFICGFDEPEHYIKNINIDNVRLPSNENGVQKIELKNFENLNINNISYYEIDLENT